ncbi:hypothetical protein SETIT_8G050600v2 [Setaria italica]|uniref:Uncharacterized protein n=1 Tax=Setaria italica TaxID=4555 RepID=A0A368S4D8_SETIT|nr:hypothetical protein SETIT_8G050600v2 [Setaria italica]
MGYCDRNSEEITWFRTVQAALAGGGTIAANSTPLLQRGVRGEGRRGGEEVLDGAVGGAAAAGGRGGHALPEAAVRVVGAVAALGALAEALPPVRRRLVQHPQELVHLVVLEVSR